MRKRFKILVSILIGLLTNAQNSGSQSQYDPKVTNVPTSPEVALLGRFGDVPVGHYTGTAQISIPLYNLKVDNIEIPLALSYHTSGIKVADEATWVGLGWNFMPEGTITQEIRGKEEQLTGGDGFSDHFGYDKFKSNFYTLAAQSQIYRFQIGFMGYNSGSHWVNPDSNDDTERIIIGLNEKRGQPDIFTYNFYGYTGKFFFNPETNNEILFMESNDDVKFSRNSQGWIATTNKGDKFYFYAIERSKTDTDSLTDIGYTFKISRIELISGKTVEFTYQNEVSAQKYPTQVAHLTFYTFGYDLITNNNSTINEKKTLIGIETEDTKIDFNLDNREDIKPMSPSSPIKKLSSIDIKSKYNNKKVRSFILNQTYFNNSTGVTEEGYKNKRLKLNSIQEVNYDEYGNLVQNIPPYSFEYETSITMPSKMSSSDFYGYCNGSSSLNLIPDLSFFDYLNKSPYKNYGLTVNYPSNSSNRFVNTQYTKANILKKVFYPTGANTEFEYESNSFSNQFVPTMQQVQTSNKDETLTHRGIAPMPTIIQSDSFKLTQDKSYVKFYNTIYDGYFAGYPELHYEPYGMYDCKIKFFKKKIVNGQSVATLIKEWKISVSGPVFEQTHQQIWDEELQVAYDSDPSTEYYMQIENPLQYRSTDGSHRAVVSSRFRFYDNSQVDMSVSYGHGLRVKSIKNFQNTTLLSHKKYTYTGGKLIYKFEPITLIKGATSKNQQDVQNGGCYIEQISIFNDISISSSDFGISANKPFGYNEVKETDINVLDGTEKGYTIYRFTNNEFTNSIIKGTPKIDIPSNGENTWVERYDQYANKISTTYNAYNDLANTYGVYPSFSLINTSIGSIDPTHQRYPIAANGCPVSGTSYTGNTVNNPLSTTKYLFVFNPLITGKRRLTTSINTTFFGANSLEEKTELSYTAAGNLDISKVTTSNGRIIETKYNYANDIGNTRLINKDMTGVPLKIETTSGNKVLSKTETKYDNTNNYLPSSVLSYDLVSNNWNTDIFYNQYDNNSNLQQYTTKSGISTAIVWGYNNTQPIAKIEGATYSQVSSLASAIISASDTDASAGANNDESSFLGVMKTFRESLPNYQVTTYTYDPLIGVRSITPPNGIKQIYIYDNANRLQEVRENSQSGNLLKEYKYNYKH